MGCPHCEGSKVEVGPDGRTMVPCRCTRAGRRECPGCYGRKFRRIGSAEIRCSTCGGAGYLSFVKPLR